MGLRRGVITLSAFFACALSAPVGAPASAPTPSFCAQPSLQASAPAAGRVLLGIDRDKARAGARVRVRIENFSKTSVGWGLAYGLARWSPKGRRWVEIPLNRIFSELQLEVDARRASECQAVEIPDRAAPGRYRVRKVVGIGIPAERHTVAATFRIVSAATPRR